MEITLYIYLAAYIAILIGVSWFVSRRESDEGYLIADRNRKWWTVSLSKFSAAIGVGYFVAYTGYAYEYGLGTYLVILGSLIGYLLYGLWAAPRLYENSRKGKFYTQGDYVAHVTGSKTALSITNILANVIIFGWLLVGVVGGAKIISHLGLLSYEIALLFTILITTSYVFWAGFRAVLATDVLQALIVLVLVAVLTWIITGAGLNEVLSAQTGTIDIGSAIGFLLFGSLSVFSYSNFYQLVYAARSKKAASIGVTSSIVPIIAVATLLLMIGMYTFLQNPNLDSGLVFLEALEHHLPASLLPMGIILFFAGLMSSADTNIYAIASHYVLSNNKENAVRRIRRTIVVIAILSLIIGYYMRDIVDLTVLAAGISLTLSVAMIYLIAGGVNAYRFIGSIMGGLAGLALGLVVIGVEPTAALFVLIGGCLGLVYNGWLIKSSANNVR